MAVLCCLLLCCRASCFVLASSGAKHLRQVAGGLVGGLGDNKKPMRDATVAALAMAITLNRHNTTASSAGTGAGTSPSPVVDASVVEVGLLAVLVGPLCEALVATAVGRQVGG